MIENIKESQRTAITKAEFITDDALQKINEEVELKYGRSFAQSYIDALIGALETPKAKSSGNQQMNTLIRLMNQLHTLSQVCSADCFHTWDSEDKVFYMTLLTDVSNDLSQALHGSLSEIKASSGKATFGEISKGVP